MPATDNCTRCPRLPLGDSLALMPIDEFEHGDHPTSVKEHFGRFLVHRPYFFVSMHFSSRWREGALRVPSRALSEFVRLQALRSHLRPVGSWC